MHGLMYTGLREYTVERLGAERADELWSDRVFELDEAYEDEWFAAQLERLAASTGETREEVEHGFGAYAGRTIFSALFPDYYAESGDVVTFLLGIEGKIHEVVRATIRGARPPHLHVQPLGDTGALISYTSERHLCRLLEGLVRGTSESLSDPVDVEEIQCMLRGDPGCVFTVVASSRG